MNTRSLTLELLLAGLLLLLSGLSAQAQTQVALDAESRLWIEGSSSVNTFTCEAGTVRGEGRFVAEATNWAPKAEAHLQVPVRSFDCGKRRMNQDLYTALKADAHDTIRFRLDDVVWVEPATDAEHARLSVDGRLTIAGTERAVTLIALGQRQADSTYRVAGSLPLLMSDFGVDPPTALLGLIKAHDRITVHFDLSATLQPFQYTTQPR